jgi:hypothetical protein
MNAGTREQNVLRLIRRIRGRLWWLESERSVFLTGGVWPWPRQQQSSTQTQVGTAGPKSNNSAAPHTGTPLSPDRIQVMPQPKRQLQQQPVVTEPVYEALSDDAMKMISMKENLFEHETMLLLDVCISHLAPITEEIKKLQERLRTVISDSKNPTTDSFSAKPTWRNSTTQYTASLRTYISQLLSENSLDVEKLNEIVQMYEKGGRVILNLNDILILKKTKTFLGVDKNLLLNEVATKIKEFKSQDG